MKNNIIIIAFLIMTISAAAQSWQTVGEENFISTGPFLSLEVNNNTQYVAVRNPNANVKRYDPTFHNGWRTVGNADLSPGLASYMRLGFENDTPYIVYTDATNGERATVMKMEGGTWTQVGSPLSPFDARHTDIVFDGSTPYVVYRDVGLFPGDLVVKSFDGTAWQSVGLDGFSDGESAESKIEIIGGEPYVAYKDFFNGGGVTVQKFNGTSWDTVGTQSFSAGDVNFLEFTFDGTTPYVAYRDEANDGKATVMMFDGTNWVTLGQAGFTAGGISSVDIEVSGGDPYVVFNQLGAEVKASLMRFDGTNWVLVGEDQFNNGDANDVQLEFINDIPVVAHSGTTVMQLCSPLNTNTSLEDSTITAEEANALMYQWGLCNNGAFSSIIDGETDQSYTAEFLPNDFAVIINQFGCLDTSACVTVEAPVDTTDTNTGGGTNGILERGAESFTIYPNPAADFFTIKSNSEGSRAMKVTVMTLSGSIVFDWQGNLSAQRRFDVAHLQKGIYIIQVTEDGMTSLQKLIKS